MRTAADQQEALRFWVLGAFAVLLCAGSAFSYLHSMVYGIAAGDLLGVAGREADVAFAQRWAKIWLLISVCGVGVSGLAGALATPIFADTPRLPQFIGRLVVALLVSFLLAILIGWVYFSIVYGSHHSLLR